MDSLLAYKNALPDIDLFCPTFQQDPYSLYARLREEQPVYWSEQIQAWIVTRHEDVLAALHDQRISANRIVPRMQQLSPALRKRFQPLENILSMWPLMLERPTHTRLRALINKAMSPTIVKSFLPAIQRQVDVLLDAAFDHAGVDAITELARPFPLNVVCEIIGAPHTGRDLLKQCAVDIVNFFGCPPHLYVERADAAMRSVITTMEFLRETVRQRRRAPENDLITALIEAQERNAVMSEDEVLATCLMMVFAGFETTTNLIGNGLLLLLQYPEEQQKLRENPLLMRSAISEMLRFESPVQRLSRMAIEDFKFKEANIRRGDLIFLMVASANRDERVFGAADRFDIARDTKGHLAFGHSIHLCPGNTLAQLEAKVFFTELIRRAPRIHLNTDMPEWQINLSVRSLEQLPISFS